MLGEQIIKGMAVTARNFFGSYASKERLTTVQYPEERLPQKGNTRQFPFLVYDGDDAEKGLRCVACQICEKECPPKCIYIVKSKDKKPDYKGQPQIYPLTFDIDISVCMSCQICVEVCPFESIKMNTEFELSTADRFGDLLLTKEKLSKPNSYYQRFIRRTPLNRTPSSPLKKPRPKPLPRQKRKLPPPPRPSRRRRPTRQPRLENV